MGRDNTDGYEAERQDELETISALVAAWYSAVIGIRALLDDGDLTNSLGKEMEESVALTLEERQGQLIECLHEGIRETNVIRARLGSAIRTLGKL